VLSLVQGVMSSAIAGPTGTHSWSRPRYPTPNLRPSPRG